MPIRRFEPTPDTLRFDSPDGSVHLWVPVPGIAASRALGFVTGDLARAAYAAIDAMPSTPLEGFLDLSASTGFDWSARMYVFRWNVRHFDPSMRFDLLITPRFVRSTRLLAHLLGDRVHLHADPVAFDAAYALALRRKTRASVRPPRAPDLAHRGEAERGDPSSEPRGRR